MLNNADSDKPVAEESVEKPSDAESDRRMAARWKPLILALLLVALLLRILVAVAVERYVENAGRQFLIEGDANGYWELGEKIAAGQDYAIHQPPRYVLRTPGLPLLLAGSIRVFGNNILAARILLAVIGTACCWLTYCLGRQIHMRRTGFWAAMIVAIHPQHIGISVLILSETLFTFWMLLSLIGLLWLIGGGEKKCDTDHKIPCAWRLWLRALLTGVLIGVAVLVRPGFLPWLAVTIGVVIFALKRAPSVKAVAITGLILGCALPLLPWAARNASVTGHWVFTSLWSGPSLYDGLNPEADGGSNMDFFDNENVMGNQGLSEFEMNEHYKQRAIEFATQNPLRVVHLAIAKAGTFLSPFPNIAGVAGWGGIAVCVVISVLIAAFAALGMASREWDRADMVVMVGPFLLFLLVHMVFVASVRYRLPTEFPLAVLAAIGWRHRVLQGGRKTKK